MVAVTFEQNAVRYRYHALVSRVSQSRKELGRSVGESRALRAAVRAVREHSAAVREHSAVLREDSAVLRGHSAAVRGHSAAREHNAFILDLSCELMLESRRLCKEAGLQRLNAPNPNEERTLCIEEVRRLVDWVAGALGPYGRHVFLWDGSEPPMMARGSSAVN